MLETRYAGLTRQEQHNKSAAALHVAVATSYPSANIELTNHVVQRGVHLRRG